MKNSLCFQQELIATIDKKNAKEKYIVLKTSALTQIQQYS